MFKTGCYETYFLYLLNAVRSTHMENEKKPMRCVSQRINK